MPDWSLRARALLDRQFPVVVAALVVLALAGGWLTYAAHVDPGTTTERRTVSSWETSGGFDHSATVRKENPVFAQNRTLRNRTVYLPAIAPILDGAFVFDYAASDRGSLSANVTSVLVVRRVTESEDEERGPIVLWQTTRLLNAESGSIGPGNAIRVPFSFNVSTLSNRTGRITEALGRPPGETEMVVRSIVDYDGRINGRQVDGVETYNLTIQAESGVYRVDAERSTEQFETTRTVAVERTPGALQAWGGPILLVASLVALGAIVTLRRRGDIAIDGEEREWLRYRDDRDDFDEWISTIRLPASAHNLSTAETESLGDLVNLAIDTDNRVIEDPEDSTYYVMQDGWLYTYHPPRATETATPVEEGSPKGQPDEPEPREDEDD